MKTLECGLWPCASTLTPLSISRLQNGAATAIKSPRNPKHRQGACARPQTALQRRLCRAAVLISLAALCLLVLPFSGRAQSYDLSWFTIDGGGAAASSGGVYTLGGTIGQPDAGRLSGGIYTLDGGFWGIVAAIQTPGAPLLSAGRSGNNVIISWPASATGYGVEENSNLSLSTWYAVSQSAVTNGGQISVTVPASVGNKFYRLKK